MTGRSPDAAKPQDWRETVKTRDDLPLSHCILAQLEQAEAEVERLRSALERVYQTGRGVHVEIAREALNV